MPALAQIAAWVLRNWRTLLLAGLLAIVWWQQGTIGDERERVAGRDREIALMREVIAQRDATVREVARQAVQRQDDARKAVEAAAARAADAERRLADLRKQRPQTGDHCADAAEILRRYREAR